MSKVYKILAVVLTVVFLLTMFAGCAQDKKDDETTTTKATTTKSETTTEMAKVEIKEIEVVTWQQKYEDIYANVIDKFENENPDIKVKFSGKTEIFTYLNTAFQSGQEGNDLFTSHGNKTPYLKNFISAGVVEVLDGKIDTTGFPKLMVQRGIVDGKLYMSPGAFGDTFPVWYNVDIFDKYSLSEPKTYDELLQICETLKNGGIQPFTLDGLNVWGVGWNFWNFVNFTSPEWSKAFNRFEAKFSDQGFAEGAKTFVDFVKKGYFGDTYAGLDGNGSILEFTTGKAAMFSNISSMNVSLKDIEGFNYSAFYWPLKQGGSAMMAGQDTSTGFSLYSKSKYKDEALKFMQYLMTKDVNQQFAELGANVPYMDGVTATNHPVLNKLKTGDVIIPLWSDQITPIAKEGINGYEVLNTNVQKLLFGKITVEQLVEELEKAVDYSKKGVIITWD